jgi:antitoxin YqcF
MKVTDDNRQLANYLRSIFGGRPNVHAYHDARNVSAVHILSAPEAPSRDAITFASIGLSDHSIGLDVGTKSLRVEFIFVANSKVAYAPNMLSTCAFNVINSGWAAQPGAVHHGVIAEYLPESPLKHVLLIDPFSWNLETQEQPSRTVAWLELLPITDQERAFGEQHGSDALMKWLETRSIDPLDIFRPSTL